MTTRRTTAPARPTARIAITGLVAGERHLTRGAERYCRMPERPGTDPTTPLPCEWHTDATYPGDADAWRAASAWPLVAARALLPLLVGLDARGRPSAAPVTEDGALVARAMAATGARTRTALARLVGTTLEQFSRCNVAKPGGTRGSAHPLTPEAVTALEGLVSAGKSKRSATVKKDT